MKITVLCSDDKHPVYPYLAQWVASNSAEHDVALVMRSDELEGGDLLFLISCAEIITKAVRQEYRNALLVHASDLPKGRGWSPHIWEVAAGAEKVTVTLLEADDQVDSGAIWQQLTIAIPGNALWDEINEAIFKAELQLMDFAVANVATVKPRPQDTGREASYYRRRTAADSRVDPEQSIADQFDTIRVCDPDRYPAFFELRGRRFKLTLEPFDE